MKIIYLVFCVIFFISTKTTSVSIREGKCVKLFYNEENSYRFHCFKEIHNILEITTKNHTIRYNKEHNKHCFKIITKGTNEENVICHKKLRTNCIKENELSLQFSTEETEAIPCKKIEDTTSYYGIQTNEFVLLFSKAVGARFLVDITDQIPDRE